MLCVKRVEGVAERSTEAATSWMTVESRIQMHERGVEWFQKVAEHAETKTARETRAQQKDKFREDANTQTD